MFVKTTQPTEYDFGGSRTRMLISGAQSGGAYCMLEIFSPAGRATPRHRHQNEDETIHMIDGVLGVEIEGTLHTLVAGDTVLLKRGTAHQLINRGDSTAHYLVVCTPGGFDGFVEAVSDTMTQPIEPEPPTQAAKQRMIEAAPRFGLTLLPPAAVVAE
ncbi:Cupin domain-containing protein [Pararobbsia alpina]|uniref:cupin domain-containing protein n=1 Tax=Pararobbsia alpina TaxID=621374 RepID=UPI0039A5458B